MGRLLLASMSVLGMWASAELGGPFGNIFFIANLTLCVYHLVMFIIEESSGTR